MAPRVHIAPGAGEGGVAVAVWGVSLYPQDVSYRAAVTLGKLAEDRGFESVFVVEGVVQNDAMAMAEAMALGTQRITVGTGIANLYLRHPATLGVGAVAIDELSNGRFILGIGASNPDMIGRLGIPWRSPRVALRETTDWLRQASAPRFGQHSIPSPSTEQAWRRRSHAGTTKRARPAFPTALWIGNAVRGVCAPAATASTLPSRKAAIARGAGERSSTWTSRSSRA
jgi:alkanesulfonate monooxygenase SsuD/methylene tetrahydromethanopterin reductase-like flavin-dependent oxidoreductase (luciferase family)